VGALLTDWVRAEEVAAGEPPTFPAAAVQSAAVYHKVTGAALLRESSPAALAKVLMDLTVVGGGAAGGRGEGPVRRSDVELLRHGMEALRRHYAGGTPATSGSVGGYL